MAEAPFEPLTTLRSRIVVLPQENIDTDQILPARFMTTTSSEGLGEAAFYDWRHDKSGQLDPDHVLNRVDPAEHRILVAGRNFGSGSSREHAPWALVDYGFRAVISSEIADIFSTNALSNGLLVVSVPDEIHLDLLDMGGREMTIDVDGLSIALPNGRETGFPLNPFARRCLMEGSDPLAWLLSHQPDIATYEELRCGSAPKTGFR